MIQSHCYNWPAYKFLKIFCLEKHFVLFHNINFISNLIIQYLQKRYRRFGTNCIKPILSETNFLVLILLFLDFRDITCMSMENLNFKSYLLMTYVPCSVHGIESGQKISFHFLKLSSPKQIKVIIHLLNNP